jgi:hypothetical protein
LISCFFHFNAGRATSAVATLKSSLPEIATPCEVMFRTSTCFLFLTVNFVLLAVEILALTANQKELLGVTYSYS